MNPPSNRKKPKGNASPEPIIPVHLPTIYSMNSSTTIPNINATSQAPLVPVVPNDELMLTSPQVPLSHAESPFMALTSQQRELQKLLMASIKKQLKPDPSNVSKSSTDEVDVKKAFHLKPPKPDPSKPAPPMLIANHIPYTKAAEEAIISEAMMRQDTSHNAPSATNIKKLHVETKPPKERAPHKPRQKEAKEKEEAKAAKDKSKDKEEIARSNKEKDERNAFRLKQLNHELTVHKYNAFFVEEATPVQMSRQKCHQDCLLEEMQWLALDFKQERRWKMASQQALAAACTEEQHLRQMRQAQRTPEVITSLRAICSRLSADISEFWQRFQVFSGDSSVPMEETPGEAADESQKQLLHDAIDKELPSLIENLRVRKETLTVEDVQLSVRQTDALNRLLHVNACGYGALLLGAPHCGKTLLTCKLIMHWAKDAYGGMEPSACVVVVVPWYAIPLWYHQLLLGGVSLEIWNRGIHSFSGKQVVLLCNQDVQSFIQFTQASPEFQVAGVVADCRNQVVELVKSTANGEVLKGVRKQPEEELFSWLSVFFATVQSSLKNRCVVVDDMEYSAVEKAHLLAAVVPSYFQCQLLLPPARRCLDLLERLKVKCEIDVGICKPHEQTIVPIPMSQVQRKKYINLLHKTEFESFQDALTLLKRVCFHEILVPDYLLSLAENTSVHTGKSTCQSFSSVTLSLCRFAPFNTSRYFDFRTVATTGKIEYLIQRLRDAESQGKRIAIIVSTDLEVTLLHKCLLPHLIYHFSPATTTSNLMLNYLSLFDTVRQFNAFYDLEKPKGAIIIVKDVVFRYPHVAPVNVDTVYILSTNWATALNVNKCLRPGADKGATAVYRLVAADSLEELMERKGGSFLHLQNYRIPDARPPPIVRTVSTFSFDSAKLFATAPYLLEYLKEMTKSAPVVGIGRGKGCFFGGNANPFPVVEAADEVDSNAGLVEWMTQFHYELETSERIISGKLEYRPEFGWPLLTLREKVIEKETLNKLPSKLARLAAMMAYRSALVQTGEVISEVDSDVANLVTLRRIQLPQERLDYMLLKKASQYSSMAEDFSKSLHGFYQKGIAVDSCLYVSPLVGSIAKSEYLMPYKRRKTVADFELQFIVQPSGPATKGAQKKSRATAGTANPSGPRRKNSNAEKHNKKSSTGSLAALGDAPQEKEYQALMQFDELDLAAIDNNFTLFSDDDPFNDFGALDF